MRVESSSSLSSAGFDTSISSQVDDATVKKIRTFGKFFSTRLVQVVVQSRTNEGFDLSCSLPGASDWFNVRVDELGEVSALVRKSLSKFPPDIPSFSIDFFLYTKDGETLPLESWSLSFDPSKKAAEDNNFVYHDLSTLLKSSMVAARMTPIHRYYVKKQGPETFVILYRIVEGTSSLDLGSDSKTLRIGNYPTVSGSFYLDLFYRTRMEIEHKSASASPVSDSYHQVALPGTTPEAAPPVFGSPDTPSSFCEVISHFSTSPPSVAASPLCAVSPPSVGSHATSPIHFVARSRSRTQSSQSGNSATAGSPTDKDNKERKRELSGSQSIVKDMPFAGLLSMSFTGSLYPGLSALPEEKSSPDTSDSSKRGSESCEAGDSSGDPPTSPNECALERTIVANEEDEEQANMNASAAPSTVVASTVKNSQIGGTCHANGDTDSDLESDEEKHEEDDSFVKIPLFGTGSSPSSTSTNAELGELISACRSAPAIDEFEGAGEQMERILKQIQHFEKTQCCFDEFVSKMKEESFD